MKKSGVFLMLFTALAFADESFVEPTVVIPLPAEELVTIEETEPSALDAQVSVKVGNAPAYRLVNLQGTGGFNPSADLSFNPQVQFPSWTLISW